MTRTMKVVIGDSDRDRMSALSRCLEADGWSATSCTQGQDVLDRCAAENPDAVVIEARLPRRDGFEVLKSLKEDGSTARIRVVLVVDAGDEVAEGRARLCGAHAILRRPIDASRIAEALSAGTGEPAAGPDADSGDLEAVLDALSDRARHENPLLHHITDPVTGLYNRPYIELKLAEEFKKARRFQIPLTAIMVTLDVPATGAEDPDPGEQRRILNEAAGLLLCESRDIDHLARYDDREFLALLPHTDISGAMTMAQRILASIQARSFTWTGTEAPLTASAGMSSFTGVEMERPDELPLRAREAMLISNRWGGNRVTVWEPGLKKARCPGG